VFVTEDQTLKKKEALMKEVCAHDYFGDVPWEEFNQKFFDGLAPKYDAYNEILSLGQHKQIKKKALERSQIKAGMKILDVCTGSGDMALWMAMMTPGADITGVDVSENMLTIAKKRASEAGLSNVQFEYGDGMKLSFESGTFDRVLISFGLRNLKDFREGLRELKRVTKPGGLVINLDLGRPRNKFLRLIHHLHFRTLIPFLGKTIFHRGEFNSFKYLPTSGKYFPDQWELADIFKQIGFGEVRRYDYMFGAVSQQVGRVEGP